MCFSAPVSFITGGVLVAAGVASLRKAGDTPLRFYAATPLLFGIQQLIEGFQWLALKPSVESTALGYAFMLFAYLIWPIYIPLGTAYAEPDRSRRRVMYGVATIGIVVVAFLLVILATRPLSVVEDARRICYVIDIPTWYTYLTFYVAATCGAALISSRKGIRVFGAGVLLSCILALVVYTVAFTSVWCFFAAVLSLIVWLDIRSMTRKQTIKPSAV